MFKAMIFTRRRADLNMEAFRDHYINRHAKVVGRMPGLRRYVQHVVLPGADGREPEFSGVAEVWYADSAAFHLAISSPEAAEANVSLARFTDMDRMQIMILEEFPVMGSWTTEAPGEVA